MIRFADTLRLPSYGQGGVYMTALDGDRDGNGAEAGLSWTKRGWPGLAGETLGLMEGLTRC